MESAGSPPQSPMAAEGELMGRTAGLRPRGKLARGAPRPGGAAASASAAPSVPTSYETTLQRGAKSPAAFWSGAPRDAYTTPDSALAPGPGAYRAYSSLQGDSASYSHKGYGGLTSRTQRFPARRVGARNKLPGPGAYEAPQFTADAQRPGAYDPQSSAAFRASARSFPGADASWTPGPGTYTAPPSPEKPASAGFRDSGSRFGPGMREHAPPPGAYDIDAATTSFHKPHSPSASAAFRNSGRSGGTQRRTHAAPEDKLAEAILRPAGTSEGPRRRAEPEGGSTDPNAIGQRLPFGVAHSAFAPAQTDRFGRSLSPTRNRYEVPPPGHYYVDDSGAKLSKALGGGARSGFVSGAARIAADAAALTALRSAPPGPAFYHPELPPSKRSFLRGSAFAV